MTTPMPLGLTPYISPATLINAPTGIDFTTIPDVDSSPAAQNAEQWNMCMRATSMVDQYCNQILRATIDTEIHHGPDFRVTVGPQAGGGYPTVYWGTTGSNCRVLMGRWPILAVNSVKVAANGVWPRSWTSVPAGYFEPENPPYGMFNSVAPADDAFGGQAVLIAPGYVCWNLGRNGYILEISYTNGWPHSSITSNVIAGATTISVSDTTGWAIANYAGTVTGATGTFKDGGQTESFTVTASTTTSGPGTLTLASALQYPHEIGTIVTTLPAAVEWACILFCTAQALTRGATSTTIHAIGGHSQFSGGDITSLNAEAELLLHPFKRTILCHAVELIRDGRRMQPGGLLSLTGEFLVSQRGLLFPLRSVHRCRRMHRSICRNLLNLLFL